MGTHYTGTAEEERALDTYIKLSRAAESVTQRVNAHLRDYDLTISQFGALEALYHLGSMQLGELGTKILKSSGNMTLVVDNLVNRGLVIRQRREDDRRCIDIHLTEAGSSLIQNIMQPHVTQVVQAFNVLSASEQEQLAALCRTLGLAQIQ
jgi:MarR family 2-MHQ and catechol resistance regulon transcriptional repressor